MKQKFLQRSLSVFMSMRQRRPFDSYTKNIHFFAFIFNRYSKNIRLHLYVQEDPRAETQRLFAKFMTSYKNCSRSAAETENQAIRPLT